MSKRYPNAQSAKVMLLVLAAFAVVGLPSARAFDAGLPPLDQSRAFQEYVQRPESDLSKLIYLIDRFKEADIEIIYEGFHAKAPFAANVAKWFLQKQYRGQTADEWILQWCNRTVPMGNTIWVKDSHGDYKASRAILMEELEKLERACGGKCRIS